ncbi:MAG: Lrp/AsnC family transcriptional regulator [Actinomycetota bacterium]
MDAIDLKIIQELTRNGRMSFAALGRRVNLSTPAVHYRVKALERSGVIRGYQARIDPDAVGLGLSAMVAVDTLHRLDAVVETLEGFPEVETCWSAAGTTDLLLRVRVPDAPALERLLVRIREIDGVDRTRSTVLLATRFEREPDPAAVAREAPAAARA